MGKAAAAVREMSVDQLVAELAETQKELFKLRFQAATEKLADPSKLKSLRRTIARLKTIAREREAGSAKS